MTSHRFLLVVSLAIAIVSTSAWAEKRSITYTTKPGTVVSRTVNAGLQPNHELIQQVRNDTTTSSDEDWNGTTVTVASQQDLISGSGMIAGYAVRHHKNGDQTFYKYRGKLVATGEPPSRQITGDGTIEMTGGTGKFSKAKGSGTWSTGKGQATIKLDVEY